MTPQPVFIPSNYSRRFSNVFAWYSRRLIRKRFNAMRLTHEATSTLTSATQGNQPLLVALNHPSWWDPLVALILARHFAPHRRTIGPMDAAQLRTFSFFKKLGLFGIDPDDPRAAALVKQYVLTEFRAPAPSSLWETVQGNFTDVRAPIRIRPGLASIAAALSDLDLAPTVLTVVSEFTFWEDQRPELCIHAESVQTTSTNTPGWQRSITAHMQKASATLASHVIARDPAAMPVLISRKGSRTNPIYDALAKLRGRSTRITKRNNTPPSGTTP